MAVKLQTSDRYYLLPDETDLYRATKSKRFITKVMFMCAVSRPQYSADGQELFDGKIGIFPFTTVEPTKRKSKNRANGVLEVKPIQSITKEVTKECIIKQDNARPHFKKDDPNFIAAANSDGFKIDLVCQPANSSDLNVNDLSFFRATQSLQDDKIAITVEDLVQNGCLTEIMKAKGSNDYKISHINK
ncbi:uncharacterized protein LOC131009959 [Salvia miltiorrhiza]|uniref:uncharacterized protein LOC131009959 n=1 Tax=Salvia miltiorrhiza TaxID=226208 RepID=UPI0025AB82CC|nr:uncharacterized protein LOC131009959 [Salvia miltiorrhiza]